MGQVMQILGKIAYNAAIYLAAGLIAEKALRKVREKNLEDLAKKFKEVRDKPTYEYDL